jgi:intein/homing endonuclease
MKKWQIAVSILLVFALGTTAGAYGSRIIFKKRVNRVLESEGTPGIKVIQGMLSRLDLSDSQRSSIEKIVNENNEKWEVIRQEYEPQIKELYETVIEETKKELTPEQREEVEQMSDKVQRRLPPRTTSPPGSSSPPHNSSNPPEASQMPGSSTVPYGGATPQTSEPPEASSVPPEMSQQPFGPKSNSDRVTEIIEQLQIGTDNSATIKSIIEMDIQTQETMRDTFEKSQANAEAEYREEAEEVKIQTEKELSEFLSAQQMETYRQLRNPEEPKLDDFGFEGPGEDMNYKDYKQDKEFKQDKDFKQEDLSNPPEDQSGNNQKGTWAL